MLFIFTGVIVMLYVLTFGTQPSKDTEEVIQAKKNSVENVYFLHKLVPLKKANIINIGFLSNTKQVINPILKIDATNSKLFLKVVDNYLKNEKWEKNVKSDRIVYSKGYKEISFSESKTGLYVVPKDVAVNDEMFGKEYKDEYFVQNRGSLALKTFFILNLPDKKYADYHRQHLPFIFSGNMDKRITMAFYFKDIEVEELQKELFNFNEGSDFKFLGRKTVQIGKNNKQIPMTTYYYYNSKMNVGVKIVKESENRGVYIQHMYTDEVEKITE